VKNQHAHVKGDYGASRVINHSRSGSGHNPEMLGRRNPCEKVGKLYSRALAKHVETPTGTNSGEEEEPFPSSPRRSERANSGGGDIRDADAELIPFLTRNERTEEF